MNTSLIFRKSEFRLFLLLALTGLILRGLYLFEYAHFANFDLAIGADVGEYHTRAQEILRGIFFPAVPDIHAPLYSFFIAGLQKIGLSLPGIRIFQTLLNYFSWISLFFLLRKKEFPEKCAFAFLGLSMILAPLIFHPAELISEALLLPLLTAVFFFIDSAENTSFRQKAVFSSSAGIFSALALLTHGMLSGFLLLETLYLFFRKKWLIGAFFAGGILLVILPFITVKSCHYGRLSGIQANTGFNIFLGNNAKANGLCYMRPGNLWRKTHTTAHLQARSRNISTDRYFLEKAFEFWKKVPLKATGLYFKKILLVFSGKEYIAGADGGFLFCRTDTINFLRFLTFPLFFFALFGVWYLCKQELPVWTPPLLLGAALLIMQILTVTSGRYRLMMFPALIYLAAIGISYLKWKKWFLPVCLIFLFSVWKTYSFMGTDKAEGTALLGQAHFLKGNYEHAEELLIFAGKRFKDSSRIDNMLGNIAERKGNIAEARKKYLKVTKEEPFMPEGWMNLANVTPDPVKADKFFRTALEAAAPAPSADLTYNYAKFLYSIKNSQGAEEMLKRTFNIDSHHVMALNLSGLLAADKKEFKAASEFFHRAALQKPQEAGFWKNTAITAQLAGNKKLEAEAAQKYLTLIRNTKK